MKKFILALAGAAVAFLCVWGLMGFYSWLTIDMVLDTEKPSYAHYDFIEVRAKIPDRKLAAIYKGRDLPAQVFDGAGKVVATIGDKRSVTLRYDPATRTWRGKWPCPWNAAAGQYKLSAMVDSPEGGKKWKIRSVPFNITSRRPLEIQPGLGVLTCENPHALRRMKLRKPDGTVGDWRTMIDWAEFVGADAFWYVGGITISQSGRLDESDPWKRENMNLIPEMGRLCHERGLKFGVWIVSYMTYGRDRYRNYIYAWDYSSKAGGWVKTQSISLADEKRPGDIARLVKMFADMPEVDFVGLDYIRNALGGYELAELFVEEMGLVVPGWDKMDRFAKMQWLYNEKVKKGNPRVTEMWEWWRAHKTSGIISRITRESKIKKPFWCFTLSWEKGWQHGQDPAMFLDAGVDMDCVMLYEATRDQFNDLLVQWKQYLRPGQMNLVLGNVVDWPLHQKTFKPSGPEEFYDRMIKAAATIQPDGPARGAFIHDITRALLGRIGPYSTKEWLLASAAALTRLREQWNLLDVELTVEPPQKIAVGSEAVAHVRLRNRTSSSLGKVSLSFFASDGAQAGVMENSVELGPKASKTVSVPLRLKQARWDKGMRYHFAARARWGDGPRKSAVAFAGFDGSER